MDHIFTSCICVEKNKVYDQIKFFFFGTVIKSSINKENFVSPNYQVRRICVGRSMDQLSLAKVATRIMQGI